MAIELVIFDCDGVLVDSEPITNGVLRDDLATRGLDLPVERVIELFVGGTMAGVMAEATGMGAEMPENWLDIIYGKVFEALDQQVGIIPGADLVLDALDTASIPYAVGSNGPMRKMEITLGRTGLWDRLMPHVYSGQECPAPKPAPDVYLKAAAIHGVPPSNCVVIEDSASGARAAVAAGMPCYGFVRETPVERLQAHCDVLFDRMEALPGLLGM